MLQGRNTQIPPPIAVYVYVVVVVVDDVVVVVDIVVVVIFICHFVFLNKIRFNVSYVVPLMYSITSVLIYLHMQSINQNTDLLLFVNK